MSFWSNVKKALGLGWKVSKFFYTPPKFVDIIADAVVETEKGKLMGNYKYYDSLGLKETALDYAVQNLELVNWAKEKTGSDDISVIKQYLHPAVEQFYDQNKSKIKSQAKKIIGG